MHPRKLQERQRGFTLLEILIVVALAFLVAGWALPALGDLQSSIRAATASRHLHGVLESTRYRSLALQWPTTICATGADTVTCDRNHGSALVVFEDDDSDGVVDAEERVVVREVLAGSEEFWLVWRAFQNRPYLRWASGRTDSMNGTFTLCNRQRKDAWLRQLVVNRTGRTRLVEPARATASVLQSARLACGW